MSGLEWSAVELIGRARRYASATRRERVEMRRNQLLRLIGEEPQRPELPHETWKRLIAEGREFELVSILEPFVVRVGDQNIGQAVFLTGQFEFEKVEAVAARLTAKPLRTVVDVGANIGTVCIPAIRRGLAQRAIAIEPDPVNFSLLTANVALNGLLDVVDLHQRAAAPSSGARLQLALADENLGDHRIAADHVSQATRTRTVTVESVTLDEVAPDLSAESDLIYMDVQGFEAQVLRGSRTLIERRVPLVIELWPGGLEAHGGLHDLAAVLDPYRSFVDLEDRDGAERPLLQLGDLYDRHAQLGTHTDILLT